MVAVGRPVAAGSDINAPTTTDSRVITVDTVDRLGQWLLAAVAVDLLLTRFLVRLAIFIPKGEPWASIGAVLGRFGAVADAIVPIVSILMLVALLARAGRRDRRDAVLRVALLVALLVVAVTGIALAYLPASVLVVLLIDLLVVGIALAAGWRFVRDPGMPAGARIGLVSLALALALAATARVVEVAPALAGSHGAIWDSRASLWIGAVGQLAFVIGAAVIGLAGLIIARGRDQTGRRAMLAGLLAGLVFGLAAAFAPLTWGALVIWSIGLTGVVPAPVVGLALGLALAGLPALHRRARAVAVGASIVLISGYGLAASGLVLAGLLGLIVARGAGPDTIERRIG